MEKKFVIRCRGIILDKGQLLVVEHTGKEGVIVLPGGHLEWGEDIKTGMVRELEEELGVTPALGDLLYIHNYTQANGKHAVEFFFAVTNAADYRTLGEKPSHAYELSSVEWIEPHDERLMRPVGVWEDFKKGTLGDGKLRFLAEGVI
jgi:8-oxo-dGTP diphosphatase